MKRLLFSVALLAFVSAGVLAQSGTNSPYSQFGLGILSDQTSGFNSGMNGLGLGFREHNQVNHLNPASYSAIDSLTFIFDAGLSGQITNFTEKGRKLNANNADLEYVVAGFRAFKHVGVSFGLIPFTNIGYNYSSSQFVGGSLTTLATNTYSGEGGIHQFYFGAGWEPFKGLSLGANISYLWGTYSRSVINSYSENTAKTLSRYYTGEVTNYRLDVGLQYTAKLSKKNSITVGATYTLGHKLNSDPQCQVISQDPQTAVADTATYIINNALSIPDMYAAGLMWNYANKVKIGFDYSVQKWAKVDFLRFDNDAKTYSLHKDMLMDRQKFTFGGEYCPQENGRSFLKRIHYRAGASYATPYIKVNGADGPKQVSASLGFGIPIMNSYNNRSLLNISGQWARSSALGLITENTFRINIGITFNELWFAKWKVK